MFKSVFKAFACFELWNRDGWDLDFLIRRLWVDAHARGAGFGHEGAEAGDGDLVSLLKSGGDNVYKGFHHVFGLFFVHTDLVCDLVNELRFVHSVHSKEKDKNNFV